MDRATAQQMTTLTCDFYRRVGPSFSATRAGAWPGWERMLDLIATCGDAPRVLDLACGNLRFERALFGRMPAACAWAVDSCDEMACGDDPRISFIHCDLAGALLGDGTLPSVPPCDAAVSFAFMHHLPLLEQRIRLMEVLVDAVRPDGIVAVSFWQFADDARLLAKARAATEAAAARYGLSAFGPDDYLMGWQDERDAFRFCHHASDAEIDMLVEAVSSRAHVVARYNADGASGRLNQYVVLEKGEVAP